MNTSGLDHRSRDGRSPTNLFLLQNPLDFISEEHLRLRTMCADLDCLSHKEQFEPEATNPLIEYLGRELPLLLADENEELVPYTSWRAEPEDEFPRFAQRLRNEHAKIVALLETVMSGLSSANRAETDPGSLRQSMRDLANETRRHLILQNAILLPLARARLSAGDLARLRTAMLKRRGIEKNIDEQLLDTNPCSPETKP